MISAEAAYLFRHALLRDAAYGLHLPGARRKLHGMVLEIFEETVAEDERGPLAAELARHAHAAQQVEGRTTRSLVLLRRELEYLKLAASWSGRNYDYPGAHAALRACAGHPLSSQLQRMTALTKLADSLANLGHPEQASLFLQEAESLDQLPEAARLLHVSRANVHRHCSRFAEAEREYLRALALTRDDEREVQAALHANLGVTRMNLGQLDSALECLDRVSDFGMPDATFCQDRAILLYHMGRSAEALKELERAAESAERDGGPRVAATVLANYASVLLNLGQHTEVEAVLLRALQVQRQIGDQRGEASALSVLGAHLTLTGKYQEALQATLRSVTLNREAGNMSVLAITLRNLAVLQLALGETDNAAAPLEESLHLELAAKNVLGGALTRTAQGMLAHAHGDFAIAIDLQREALAACEALGDPVHACDAQVQLGRSLRDAGRLEEAGATLQHAVERAAQIGRSELLAAATGHQALLWRSARQREAESRWAEAMQLCGAPGHRLVRDELERDRRAQV